jgi:virulence-associated protein VagC
LYSPAVPLPKEFEFDASETFMRKKGVDVLPPRRVNWTAFLRQGLVGSNDFMRSVEKLLVQERKTQA